MTRTAVSLLSSLLTRTLDRPDDPDHRELLEEFVRDLLLLLGRVECPAATLFVTSLGRLLCLRLAPRDDGAAFTKEEQAARVAAVELLGSMLSTIAMHREAHRAKPLSFPPPKEDVDEDAQPTDAGENAVCVCGEGYNGEFMLDCDLCHRWFHATCVGVDAADDSLPEEWHCDACRLSTAVLDQRKRIARLLSLHGGDAAGGDGGDDDEGGGEVVDALSSEWEVTKQLLLNCLDASADAAAPSAQQMLLCEWHAAAAERGQPALVALYREQHTAATARQRARQRAAGGVLLPAPCLSPEAVKQASRRALAESGLFDRLEPMLGYLCAILRESQTTARQKAVKALTSVVRADPDVLRLAQRQLHRRRHRREPSISVREATLDLLGGYILQRPEFVEAYYPTIAARIADVGVSVRKRVIKILRELCLKQPASPRAVDACKHLVTRVGDEEAVHDLVLKTFHELWFGAGAGAAGLPQGEVAARAEQLVAVVAGAKGNKQSAEWLGHLLRDLLAPTDEKGKAMKEAAAVTRACTQLVDQLFEICLQLEEDEENGIRTRAAEAQARLGHVLHALSLFCAARPSLIVPHIAKLPSYLEYDFCAPAIRHVCEMLPLVVPAIDHPPHALLTKLETFLAALAFRIPEPLLAAGVKALCAVAAASLNHALVRETLSRFCNMIGRADDAAEAERLQKQVCRAMLCAGLLLCHFDYDAPAPAATTYYRTADIVIDGVAIAHGRVHDTVFECCSSTSRASRRAPPPSTRSRGSATRASAGPSASAAAAPSSTARSSPTRTRRASCRRSSTCGCCSAPRRSGCARCAPRRTGRRRRRSRRRRRRTRRRRRWRRPRRARRSAAPSSSSSTRCSRRCSTAARPPSAARPSPSSARCSRRASPTPCPASPT